MGWVLFGLIVLAAYLLTPTTWAATAVLAIASAVLAVLVVQAEAGWRVRRALTSDTHADEPYGFELDAAGIRIWCAHVDARYTWDGITRVQETSEFYLFLRGPNGGPALPKRVLDDRSEEELRARIGEWSPDRGAGLARIIASARAPAT